VSSSRKAEADGRGDRESGGNGSPNWIEEGLRGNAQDRECKNLVLEDGGQGALTEPGNPSGVACDPDTPLRHGRSEQSVERLIPERRNREVEMRRLKDVERRKSPPNLSPKRFRGNPE
jgi:hypothetical protein